jgi:lipoprotein-releasing system ATP-binding protein
MRCAVSKILECDNVAKSYHDGSRELKILSAVDLSLSAGEVLAISGTSGVGKSTLLHILGTLDTPTAGEVRFRGENLAKLGKRALNRIRNKEIGFVFQFYHLLPEFTALENVMMPARCTGVRAAKCRPRAEELLGAVGLTERMTHKPGQLSGGEQQRVAIARALFNKPSVVLCDEPTGNLDEQTGDGILSLLWELNASEGTAFVVVTHDDTLAARADRWVNLHDGAAHVRK